MTDELRQTIDAQAERIVRLERQLDARTAALEAVTRRCAELEARQQDRGPEPLVAAPQAPRLSWVQRIRKLIILTGGRLLPGPAKRFVKRYWDPWALPRRVSVSRANVRAKTVIPTATTFDVICFSIIDWDFRWQRPQQLLSQFAE